jgi:hypothetical protein
MLKLNQDGTGRRKHNSAFSGANETQHFALPLKKGLKEPIKQIKQVDFARVKNGQK